MEKEHVVLLHGLSGSSRWWRRIVPLLADRFDVHAVDLPRGYRLATAPEWLLGRLGELGLPRAHLVGHSLGGLVVARVAAHAPERVGRLVLIAPAGVGLRPSVVRMAAPALRSALRARGRFAVVAATDALRAGPLRLLRTARDALADTALVDELPLVRAPTLLVWGERDPLLPPALAKRFLAALPDARLHVVPGAGHVPMEDAPADVAAAVLEHLQGLTAGSGLRGRPPGQTELADP